MIFSNLEITKKSRAVFLRHPKFITVTILIVKFRHILQSICKISICYYFNCEIPPLLQSKNIKNIKNRDCYDFHCEIQPPINRKHIP